MSRLYSIIIIIIIMWFSVAYALNMDDYHLLNQEEIMLAHITKAHSEKEVDAVFDKHGHIDKFMQNLGLTEYKVRADGRYAYTVLKVRRYSVLWIYYDYLLVTDYKFSYEPDEEGYMATQWIRFSEEDTLSSISDVAEGMTLEYVLKTDPDCYYSRNYASSLTFPEYTFHFYSNGDAFYIYFKDGEVVYTEHFTI